jgi:hypothetical protein
MRVACSLFLAALLVHPSFSQSSAPPTQEKKDQQPAQKPETLPLKQPLAFGLEDATPVKLRINRNISSADAQVNETVDFEVLEEVKVHDVIVIPRGGTAWGTVTEAQPKRRMGRAGKLNINIDNVRLTSGEKVALRAIKDVKGGGHQGAITGAIVATSIVFFPAAPLFLLVHGKDITIPKGTEITAYINGDIPLDSAKFRPQAAAQPAVDLTSSQPAPTAAPAQGANAADPVVSSVEVKSSPDGADITVDEKYMGSTPSTLKLTPGEHKVKLEKSGFKTWERTLTVGAGTTTTVNPTLDKEQTPI